MYVVTVLPCLSVPLQCHLNLVHWRNLSTTLLPLHVFRSSIALHAVVYMQHQKQQMPPTHITEAEVHVT